MCKHLIHIANVCANCVRRSACRIWHDAKNLLNVGTSADDFIEIGLPAFSPLNQFCAHLFIYFIWVVQCHP